jgi:hypothetical protein
VRYLVGGIIGLLVGLLIASIGFLYSLAPLSADGILDAIITIVVGCALAFMLQHLFHNQQREKDFLMKRLEQLHLLAEQLREQGKEVIHEDQNALFKQMSMSSNAILEIARELSRNALPVNDFDFTADVHELRNLADPYLNTLLQHANDGACNVEVSSGIRKLTEPILEDLVAKSHALCGRIAKAEVLVIRA